MDCCSSVELRKKNPEEKLKALGKYTLKQGSIIDNRPVYLQEESGSHLLFGVDGWKVIPNAPEHHNDPPLVSFVHCKPPRESVCPDRCVNDGNWTFYSPAEGRPLNDTEKALSLSCYNHSEGGVGAEAVVGIIIALLFAVVLLILFIYHHKPDWLPKWPQSKLPQLKLGFLKSSNGEQSHPDGHQSDSLIENGDKQLIPVKNGNEQKKKTPKVVVSPKMIQLPIDKCFLRVSGVPTAKEEITYKYKLSLKKDSKKDNDDNLEELLAEYNGNILQLSQFKFLTHGVYNYKLKVTSSDQMWEGEDFGQLTIYPASSMTAVVYSKTVDYALIKCTNIQRGHRIWSNSCEVSKADNITISKLPYFLKGTSLFKLPLRHVEKGTIFTITALPSSTIYIVQEKDGGWYERFLSSSDPSWSKKDCTDDPFEPKIRNIINTHFPKTYTIFCLKTNGTTTVLPEVTHGKKNFAIFLNEGSDQLSKEGITADKISTENLNK